MATEFFRAQRQSMLELLGPAIGCTPDDLASDQLTIVDRPAEVPWYVALAVSFGTGAVVSVQPELRSWVEANAPTRPRRSLRPVLLQRLVEECSTPERRLEYHVPSICWALSEEPALPDIPAGYSLDQVTAEWMAEEVKTGRWENGIGEFASDGRNVRNQYGFLIRDFSRNPALIAGVFETYGMLEIGVDVIPEHQGHGLAPVVVTAAARKIISQGRTPLYGCAADNLRSQRTALASGFLPAYVDAAVGVRQAPAPGL